MIICSTGVIGEQINAKNIIENLSKLKYIITSGLRNKEIELAPAKKRKSLLRNSVDERDYEGAICPFFLS